MPAKRRVAALFLVVAALFVGGCTGGTTDDPSATASPSSDIASHCAEAQKKLARLPGAEDMLKTLERMKNTDDVYAVIWMDVHRLKRHGCPGHPAADPGFLLIDKHLLDRALEEAEPGVLSKTIYRPVASELAALVRLPGSRDDALETFYTLLETVDWKVGQTGVNGYGPVSDTQVSGHLFVGSDSLAEYPERHRPGDSDR